MELHRNLKPWQPGQSGNPSGRPLGSRTAFSQGFHRDLAEVWAAKGKEAMLYTAEKQPAVFFATCARLIGPEVKLTIEQNLPGNLDAESWMLVQQVVLAMKETMDPASLQDPKAALQHALSALRQAEAQTINCPENDRSSDSLICSWRIPQ
jgi:hypothetical protein